MPKGIKGFQKGNEINLIHSHAKNGKKTKIYNIWRAMCNRCNNPNNKAYKNYGGRGIKVCPRWNSFENFLTDMGEKPEGLIMDRIDNNGNYEPSNCRWTDRKTSNHNSRHVNLSITKAEEIRRLYIKGYKHREIAEQYNINQSMVSKIINNKIWN